MMQRWYLCMISIYVWTHLSGCGCRWKPGCFQSGTEAHRSTSWCWADLCSEGPAGWWGRPPPASPTSRARTPPAAPSGSSPSWETGKGWIINEPRLCVLQVPKRDSLDDWSESGNAPRLWMLKCLCFLCDAFDDFQVLAKRPRTCKGQRVQICETNLLKPTSVDIVAM